MVYSHKYKSIFIHIPKCGGTTIEQSLNLIDMQSGYGIEKGKAMQHYTWSDYIDKLGHDVFNDYYKFAIVRNPYDRVISEYYWCYIQNVGYKHGQSLDDFITYLEKMVTTKNYNETIWHDHFMPQYLYIYDKKYNIKVDKVFKMEDFLEVDKFILNKYGIKITQKHNTGDYDKSKIHLTDIQKEKIYNLYKTDFVLFGY